LGAAVDSGLKATREQIVEVALVPAYEDLTNLKTPSLLPSQEAGRQERGRSKKNSLAGSSWGRQPN
jgi:hypothetical protein